MRGALIEQVNVLLALTLVIIAIILVTKPPAREKFSAIYILDSENSIQNYPDKSGDVNFTIGVHNYLGERADFEVLLRIGDENTGIGDNKPSDLPLLESFEFELEHDQSEEISINLRVNSSDRTRVIAELWNNGKYTGRWVQLWLN